MNYRPLRVGKLIRAELSKLIAREVELEGTLPTVTGVKVDDKLERAEVEVSILPPEKAEGSLPALRAAQGRLQHELMKKLNIKPMPRIEFVLDRGPERAAAVEKLLIEENNKQSGHVAK